MDIQHFFWLFFLVRCFFLYFLTTREDVLEIRQIHHTDIGHSGEIHLTVIHIAIIHHIQCLLHAVLADADLIGQMDHLSRFAGWSMADKTCLLAAVVIRILSFF